MNDLFNILMQRQMQQQELPQVPPNPATKIPQQLKRWSNAQQIQDAYKNNWSPNPVLLRAMLGQR